MNYNLQSLENNLMTIEAIHEDDTKTYHNFELTPEEITAIQDETRTLKDVYLDNVAMLDEAFDGQRAEKETKEDLAQISLSKKDLEKISVTQAQIDAKKEEFYNED